MAIARRRFLKLLGTNAGTVVFETAAFAHTQSAPEHKTSIATKKFLVAHRGAFAYAPEHTLESYQLALEQGADFVKQDLQIANDGVLVCLHDLTLERVTNIK